MSGETQITVIGNLTADPELRFTPSGAAVANFTIASTPRVFKNNEWADGDTLFLRASIWREAAENVAASLTKGMRVIVSGKLKSRNYEKDGEKRTVMELEVDEIGPSLKYAQARVQRTTQQAQGGQQGNSNDYNAAQQNRGGFGGPQQGGFGGGGGQQQAQGGYRHDGGMNTQGQWGNQPQAQQQPPAQQQQPRYGTVDPAQAAAQNDPWGNPGVSNAGGWGNGPDSEPPF